MSEVALRRTPRRLVAYVSHLGPYAGVFEKVARLESWLDRHFVRPAGFPMAIHMNGPPRGEKTRVRADVLIPIEGRVPEEEGVRMRVLRRRTVASSLHLGPLCDLPKTYADLRDWIQENGYRIAGKPREEYRGTTHTLGERTFLLLEIQIPIRKRSARKDEEDPDPSV